MQQSEKLTEQRKNFIKESESFVTKFEDAMDDDFNTADALAAVFELVKFCQYKCNRRKLSRVCTGSCCTTMERSV